MSDRPPIHGTVLKRSIVHEPINEVIEESCENNGWMPVAITIIVTVGLLSILFISMTNWNRRPQVQTLAASVVGAGDNNSELDHLKRQLAIRDLRIEGTDKSISELRVALKDAEQRLSESNELAKNLSDDLKFKDETLRSLELKLKALEEIPVIEVKSETQDVADKVVGAVDEHDSRTLGWVLEPVNSGRSEFSTSFQRDIGKTKINDEISRRIKNRTFDVWLQVQDVVVNRRDNQAIAQGILFLSVDMDTPWDYDVEIPITKAQAKEFKRRDILKVTGKVVLTRQGTGEFWIGVDSHFINFQTQKVEKVGSSIPETEGNQAELDSLVAPSSEPFLEGA